MTSHECPICEVDRGELYPEHERDELVLAGISVALAFGDRIVEQLCKPHAGDLVHVMTAMRAYARATNAGKGRLT